jgi:hypothetical protein
MVAAATAVAAAVPLSLVAAVADRPFAAAEADRASAPVRAAVAAISRPAAAAVSLPGVRVAVTTAAVDPTPPAI